MEVKWWGKEESGEGRETHRRFNSSEAGEVCELEILLVLVLVSVLVFGCWEDMTSSFRGGFCKWKVAWICVASAWI